MGPFRNNHEKNPIMDKRISIAVHPPFAPLLIAPPLGVSIQYTALIGCTKYCLYDSRYNH